MALIRIDLENVSNLKPTLVNNRQVESSGLFSRVCKILSSDIRKIWRMFGPQASKAEGRLMHVLARSIHLLSRVCDVETASSHASRYYACEPSSHAFASSEWLERICWAQPSGIQKCDPLNSIRATNRRHLRTMRNQYQTSDQPTRSNQVVEGTNSTERVPKCSLTLAPGDWRNMFYILQCIWDLNLKLRDLCIGKILGEFLLVDKFRDFSIPLMGNGILTS